MKRRVLSLVLALVLCVGLAPRPARAAGAMQIATAEDLVAFAERVNGGEIDLDAMLTADINMSGTKWLNPIYKYDIHGNYVDRPTGYIGIFDGAGHTISGLHANCGLFGKIGVGGVVKDLTLNTTSLESLYVLVYCNAGTISNCHTSGNLHASDGWFCPLVGGLVSELGCSRHEGGYDPGTVVDCSSSVNIYFTSSDANAANYGYYIIGGIVGDFNKGTVDRCSFSGSIQVSGPVPSCSAKVGGICGSASDNLINCKNNGRIEADVYSPYNIPLCLGGIVGDAGKGVKNCWNTGEVRMTSTGVAAGGNGISGGRQRFSGGLDEAANCWSSGVVTVTSDSGDTAQGGSSTCYFLAGTNYNSGDSPTFSQADLTNGVLVAKLNDYIRAHPDEGLLAWVQGPQGPELSDSYTPATAPSVPAASSTSTSTSNASGFLDVPENQYYYDPVIWAVQRGIAAGTGSNAFSPERTCTKADILTFLWRAMGQPEPQIDFNLFEEAGVSETDYYYKPLLWGMENGAVEEGSNTFDPARFDPKAPCTRLTAVFYIWAALGYPDPVNWDAIFPFQDVDLLTIQGSAVLWAMTAGVTGGTSTDTFSPSKTCTRGEIVTFLYRAMNK